MIDKYIVASFLIISSILILITKFLWKISVCFSGGDVFGAIAILFVSVCLLTLIIPMILIVIYEIDKFLGLSEYLRKRGRK